MYENLLILQNTILVKAGCFCREILFLLQDLVWIYQNMKQSFLRCVGALAKHICEADFGTLYKSSGGFMLLISEILICHWLFSIWNRFIFFFFWNTVKLSSVGYLNCFACFLMGLESVSGVNAVKPISVLGSWAPAGKGKLFFPLTLWQKCLFSACSKKSMLLSHLLLTLLIPSGMHFLLIDISVTQSYKITYSWTLPPE